MEYKQKVFDLIKPSTEEIAKLESVKTDVINAMEKIAKEKKFELEIVPGGSTAKNTFLKGNFDIDLFVRFNKDTHGRDDISNLLEELIKKLSLKNHFKYDRIHGSRDYFQFTFNDLFFEVVPVLLITDPLLAENITDMSPLHVLWVKDKIKKHLADEVRLLKQFCKATQTYGAESYINGFSGHVIEILTVFYGGFESVLKASLGWDEKEVIDVEKYYINSREALLQLNSSKTLSPLVVIDPIDSLRNASAALSDDKLSLFKLKAEEFLHSNESEKLNFFTIPKFNGKELLLRKKDTEFLAVLTVKPLEGKDDVVRTKIYKIFDHINKLTKKYDFEINDCDLFHEKSKSFMFFKLPKVELDEIYVRRGPPKTQAADVERFKEKHPDAIVKTDGFYYCEEKRKYTHPKKLFEDIVDSDYAKERSMEARLEFYS